MSRVLQSVLALGLFIGVGYVTRYYYRQWMESTIKEAAAAGRETGKWKAVKTNFDGIKFDKPIMPMPKIDIPRPPSRSGPKDNPIR